MNIGHRMVRKTQKLCGGFGQNLNAWSAHPAVGWRMAPAAQKSCRNCSRQRESNPLSLDALSETGTEAVDVFSLVCDTKRKAWCCKIANQAYRLEF